MGHYFFISHKIGPVRKPHFRFDQKVRSRSDIGILGENTDLPDLSFDVASYNLAKLYLV